ncbi:MarR family winged helix-turn-helix transcriptional regulator [Microbacterium nymphoidis]|uniref:MarR family winged helix-turn-helix transcriptional regulator n=1 Tax=Microbacterium nymphoidis TaxID=2898586 RepID=UPI001E30E0FB|nr:helix-turn-helix domain-containing protein [Microbacterium nymphoidis]MCD2499418.1 MarR family transcriptional regulator [Microbacterium nymphoidis]
MNNDARRADAIVRQAEAMRDFQARSVVFQDAVARSVGLNGTDVQAVGLLLGEGPATPGELAARTGLTSGGAVTAMIDRLERAGYVTRSRDESDRRRVIVAADADALMADLGPVYARVSELWGEYLDTLSVEQVEFAAALLQAAADVNRRAVEEIRRG